jgi:hypothetical protein
MTTLRARCGEVSEADVDISEQRAEDQETRRDGRHTHT